MSKDREDGLTQAPGRAVTEGPGGEWRVRREEVAASQVTGVDGAGSHGTPWGLFRAGSGRTRALL